MHVPARTLLAAAAATALLGTGCGSGTPPAAQSLGSSVATRSGDLLQQARSAGVLRVANTQQNPPYSMVDQSNQVVGFDVDVAKEIAKRMGIARVEFVPGTFQTFIPGLQAGKWDAVISGLTITDERKRQVEFSCPYQVNAVSIFVSDRNSEIKALADLSGNRVAVSAGSQQEQQARALPKVKVLTYDTSTLALRDVATGRADAYIGSRFTGAYLAQKNSLEVRPSGADLSTETNGMAFPKGQTGLARAADAALAAMVADGTLSAISRKWLGGLDVVRDLPTSADC